MACDVNPYLVDLYQRAAICRSFPAYKLEDLSADGKFRRWEPLYAIQLLNAAQKIRS